MQTIDRYELSVPGHMSLIDARSALNNLQRLVQEAEGAPDSDQFGEMLALCVEALHDAADDAIPVNHHDAFMRQACEWNYIGLSPIERDVLHQIRCCTDEGKSDIYQMVRRTLNRKPISKFLKEGWTRAALSQGRLASGIATCGTVYAPF